MAPAAAGLQQLWMEVNGNCSSRAALKPREQQRLLREPRYSLRVMLELVAIKVPQQEREHDML
jgi:hypothetical protein